MHLYDEITFKRFVNCYDLLQLTYCIFKQYKAFEVFQIDLKLL